MKGILEQLRSVITGDGNTSTAKDYRIGHSGGFTVYLYALGIRSPFRVTYRYGAGSGEARNWTGCRFWRTKAWDARNPKPDTNADLKFLDDGKIAVLTIRHWYEFADPNAKSPSSNSSGVFWQFRKTARLIC